MRNLYRGIRNVWRNRSRTVVVLCILALAAGLGLVMLALEEGVSSQVGAMEASVGTMIEIRPAGVYGMMSLGGLGILGRDPGTPADDPPPGLPTAMLEEIAGMPGVTTVAPYVMTIARDQATSTAGMRFARGRMVYGVAPGGDLTVLGGGQVEVVSGRGLEPGDEGMPVVVIGTAIAEREGVGLGDRLLIQDRWFRIVGLHQSALRMAGLGIFMPYDVALEVFELEGLTQIYVWADSIGRVDALRETLQGQYGEIADVVAQKDSLMGRLDEAFSSLSSASRLGLLLSLLAAGVVVFGSMYLVVRERAREIGILKAVGASPRDIVVQFGTEAIALSLAGALLGLALFVALGPAVASRVVQAAAPVPAVPRMAGEILGGSGGEALSRFGDGAFGRAFMGGGRMGMTVGTVEVALTWSLAAKAILGGLGLGLAGGLIPSLVAARLKPAEVIRRD
ncbi:MAG: ABC transporter permease [bacterium]|nr:ABC transporter permease [bacterium]